MSKFDIARVSTNQRSITNTMERTEVVNPAFRNLMYYPVDVNSIKVPLSTMLDGFLKNLKYNIYPEANDLCKAALFIQNAALIYSDNLEELFLLVTDLNKALYIIKPLIINTPTPSTSNSLPSSESNTPQEEEDEQVASLRTRKQSRKRLEDSDIDPIDIQDSWTLDPIDSNDELIPKENNENHFDLFSDQDLEVETVLGQCDNLESTSSFICRQDILKDKSKDVSKREYRILTQMTDEGIISSDFDIFDNKRSKRFSNLVSDTVDLLEVPDFSESINRDSTSAINTSSILHSADNRESGQEDVIEVDPNQHRRLDVNKNLFDEEDDGFDNFSLVLDPSGEFLVNLPKLESLAKKHLKRSMLYKYAFYRDIHFRVFNKFIDATTLHGSTPYPIEFSTNKFYSDPDISFEGFQTMCDQNFHGWTTTEDIKENEISHHDTSPTDNLRDLDESEYIPESLPLPPAPKPNIDGKKDKFTKKASKWIELWKPIVQRTANAKKFDINEYGDKVLETITLHDESIETPEKAQTLEDVLGTQTFQEASKYFLAVLVLANNGNVELEKSTDPLRVNKCNITLLSQERHYEKFNQDTALHPEMPEPKKRKNK